MRSGIHHAGHELRWPSKKALEKLMQLCRAVPMNALRPVTATALALWLGFLACVLGCAQPIVTSTLSHAQVSKPTADQGDGDKMAEAGSCCHHHHGTSDKSNHGLQTISCCPLDATLIQKEDPASPKSSH